MADLSLCIFFPLITAGAVLVVDILVSLVLPADTGPGSLRNGLVKLLSVAGALITFVLSIGLVRGYVSDPERGGSAAVRPAPSELARKIDEVLGAVYLGEAYSGVAGRERWKERFLPPANLADPRSFRLARDRRLELEAAGPAAVAAWEEAVELSFAREVALARNIQFVEYAHWIPRFKVNYFLGADGLSLPLVWLTALLGVLCLVYSWSIDRGTLGFYVLFLILETGLLGVFCALDFFVFYVFWEIVLLPMYFLIGIWGGPNRLYAAIKFFIYTLVGSVLMLIVMLVMYFTAEPHTFNLLTLMRLVPHFDPALTWWLFVGLFIGFAIKVPIFPFHTWLPDAHVEAPTSVSVVLAGILLKMGGYGFFRFNYPMMPHAATSKFFIALMAVLGMINIVYGAFCAMAQKDFKKLVAYSSVSHMGYVLLGLAALTYVGVNGAALQMFNHGVTSAMLFLLVGVIYDRAHHRDLSRFGGIALQMPWYTGLATVGFFASLGLPGLNGFVSEVMCFIGAWDSEASLITTAAGASEGAATHGGIGAPWIVLVSLLGIVLGACYILWTIQRVYLGTIRNEEYRRFPDVTFREVFALAPLAFLCVVLGVYPKILIDFMDPSLRTMAEMARSLLGS